MSTLTSSTIFWLERKYPNILLKVAFCRQSGQPVIWERNYIFTGCLTCENVLNATSLCVSLSRCVSIFFVEFQLHFERDYATTAWIHSLIDSTTMFCGKTSQPPNISAEAVKLKQYLLVLFWDPIRKEKKLYILYELLWEIIGCCSTTSQ